MTNLKDVKIGSWLEYGSGIYEVISDYDDYNDCYLVREVILDTRSYILCAEEIKMTSREVKKAQLLK